MVEQTLDRAQNLLVLPHLVKCQCVKNVVRVCRTKFRHEDVRSGHIKNRNQPVAFVEVQLTNILSECRDVLAACAKCRRHPYRDEEDTEPAHLARGKAKTAGK